ncbi:MAG: homoserine dehydrogenase [Sphaerochaetaceae bacterium]|nr:homoserine dehydrogenase [Sphaerochaetaceae bacterium]
MNISILGFGTVGRGVYEMIQAAPGMEARKVLVLPQECTESFMVTSIDEITSDAGTDTVVECMGGIHPAYEFASASLKAGKSFVTSNKALVANFGIELQALAEEKGVSFLFSAACGGGIPVLHNISVASQTDSILKCGGILNGTTNFILTKMQGEGKSYQDALFEAQKLGYAEKDPSADVSGLDTLRKVMLLSSVSFSVLPAEGLCREGIENFTSSVADYLSDEGRTLRLMGECGKGEKGIYAYVEPVAVKKTDVEASISSNINYAWYLGENSGLIGLSGQGAGRYPTASAVLRDLSAIMEGKKSMLGKDCVRGVADNSGKECRHTYLLCCDGRFEKTPELSVSDMHEMVRSMREKGSRVFFAQYR